MCITFLCLGLLSHRLRNSDYTIVFKGGKVAQMMYPNAKYKSDDIDIVLVSKNGYDREQMRIFSLHIGYLLQYISGGILPVSLRSNTADETVFPDVVKISVEYHGYIPVCDIDFSNSLDYLKHNISINETVNGLKLLFRHPSEKAFFIDKLKYFIQFSDLKFTERTKRYDYLISKFKRALLAIQAHHTKKMDFANSILEYIQANFRNDVFVAGVAGHEHIQRKILLLLSPI